MDCEGIEPNELHNYRASQTRNMRRNIYFDISNRSRKFQQYNDSYGLEYVTL